MGIWNWKYSKLQRNFGQALAGGAAFSYATPGEVLPGDYAAVPGAVLGGGSGGGDGAGSVLLVGWGLANGGGSGAAVAAAAAAGGGGSGGNTHAVAVIHAPRSIGALCAVASRSGGGGEEGAVLALSTGAGAVACGPLGSHPAGFRAVLLLTAGGSASAPLLGAQVEFVESAVVVSATPALGPLGGGGIAWISGVGLHRAALGASSSSAFGAPCSFGGGVAGLSALVSSGLVACEALPAPPFEGIPAALASVAAPAAPVTPVARAVPLSDSTNAGTYTYLPRASVADLEPDTGTLEGGTRLRVRLDIGGAGGGGAAVCRFGAVVVTASPASLGDDGFDGILCAAPASRPGWVNVAVGGARGAACDSSGTAFTRGAGARFRYHTLD